MMHPPRTLYKEVPTQVNGIGLLMLRLWIGYEFGLAGYIKLQDLSPPLWFTSLTFPWPNTLLSAQVNWVSAGVMEITLGLAIAMGLYSRFSSLALIYVTYVAIYTVHFDLGWGGWNLIETDAGLGFKVPLMLGLMLLTILTQGPGRFSLDHILTQPTYPAD